MKRFITIFRYLALVGVGIETYAVYTEHYSIAGWLIMLLLYALNFQLRYFNPIYRKITFFSLLLDLTMIAMIYLNFQLFSLLLLLIYLFDSFLLQERKLALIHVLLLALLALILTEVSGIHYTSFHFIYSIMVGLVSFIVSDYQTKYQQLEEEHLQFQHQLNELEKSKEVMEQYMGSMREMYTLKERNRLSRELHDSVGHSLSTIIIQLGAITKLAEKDSPPVATMSASLREFATKSMQQVREQLAEMKPDQFGKNQVFIAIDEMIQDYRKNTAIQVNFGISEQHWLLSEKQELLLYRTIQEFLSNSAKHGEATRINIFLHFNESNLILTMKDNGKGTEEVVPHLGLLSVKERMREARGEYHISTSPGNGFQLQVTLEKERRMINDSD